MEFFLIYLYFVLHKLSIITSILLVVVCIVSIVGIILYVLHTADTRDLKSVPPTLKKVFLNKKVVISLVSLVVLTVAPPSKKDIAWIIGGGIVWNISQGDEIRQLPESLAGAANTFLESVRQPEENTE